MRASVLLLLIANSFAIDSITCHLERQTIVEQGIVSAGPNAGKRFVMGSDTSTSLDVSISGIYGKVPRLIGNEDSTGLERIKSVPFEGDKKISAVYFKETTELGYLNIYTYFPTSRILILSKQYSLLREPFGTQLIGYCQEH